jgi:hypothetical protein
MVPIPRHENYYGHDTAFNDWEVDEGRSRSKQPGKGETTHNTFPRPSSVWHDPFGDLRARTPSTVDQQRGTERTGPR